MAETPLESVICLFRVSSNVNRLLFERLMLLSVIVSYRFNNPLIDSLHIQLMQFTKKGSQTHMLIITLTAWF